MRVVLSDREQTVLRYRYGFDESQMHNVDETAQQYQMTPARIDQIEGRAFRKLGWEQFHGHEGFLRAIAAALQGCGE
jgi:DNA-directed RNA polymerase sigma subunit (sigma70/sigma32)